jgi:ABC-type lipoprotein export system ATPase subunit
VCSSDLDGFRQLSRSNRCGLMHADELSGGQFVLVNEAVNLGIAIHNMRQGEGIRYETLFRDETVGALDATSAKEYVRMLRRAMDLGGFHQVIFICHTPLVWELADRILSVGDGRVVVGNSEGVATGFSPSVALP